MPIDSQLERNKTVVRRYIEECINDGNMALVDEFFVPERADLVKQFHAGNAGPFRDGKIEWDTMSMEWTDAIEQLGGRIMPPAPAAEPA
jgi:hypothetical protein